MKKSRQIFGAVALSAVLAFGTAVPAFADNPDGLETGNATDATEYDKNNLDANGASTNVNIATYSSNYSVTVPLYAPFMLDTAGGTGVAPTNYYIKNGGEAAVYVTNVKWTMNETSDWTFGEADGTQLDPLDVVITKTPAVNPTYGSFVITLSPNGFDGAEVKTIVPAPTSGSNAAEGEQKTKWIIGVDDPKTSKVDESMNMIDLSIQGSKLFRSLDNIQTSVASITYTVDSRAPEDIQTTPGA